jgi:hypothetical protein
MISGSGWRSNACPVAAARSSAPAQAASRAPSSARAPWPMACSISGGWRRHGAANTWCRRAAWAARRRWRPARRNSPTSSAGVSLAACAGVGAAASRVRASGRMIPPRRSPTLPGIRGSCSRSSERSLLWARVRSQTASWGARASTAIAPTSSESAGSGRWAARSVRRMLANTSASAWSHLLARDRMPLPVAACGHRVDRIDGRPVARRQATSSLARSGSRPGSAPVCGRRPRPACPAAG